jgi:hypothetical protein
MFTARYELYHLEIKRGPFLVLGTKRPIRWSSSPWCNHYITELSWLFYSGRVETLNSLLRNFNISVLKTKFGLNRSKWAEWDCS